MDDMDDLYEDPQRLYQAITGGNPNLPVPVFLSVQQVSSEVKKYSRDIFVV